MRTIEADDYKARQMDIDVVHLEVKNDESVVPVRVQCSNIVSVGNHIRLTNYYISSRLMSLRGQDMKARLGYPINRTLFMINQNENI